MNSPSDMFSDQYSERLFSVIQMLQRSALMNMGAIPDYEGMIHFNLGEAKAAIDAIEAVQSKTTGTLIIKEYPTASAGANHYRALVNELALKRTFKPDIIFIDYINICLSLIHI